MVDIGNVIVSAHHKSLGHGGMAQYFFDQAQLINFTIAQGERNFSETVFQVSYTLQNCGCIC